MQNSGGRVENFAMTVASGGWDNISWEVRNDNVTTPSFIPHPWSGGDFSSVYYNPLILSSCLEHLRAISILLHISPVIVGDRFTSEYWVDRLSIPKRPRSKRMFEAAWSIFSRFAPAHYGRQRCSRYEKIASRKIDYIHRRLSLYFSIEARQEN
jgi:hypothetical protein